MRIDSRVIIPATISLIGISGYFIKGYRASQKEFPEKPIEKYTVVIENASGEDWKHFYAFLCDTAVQSPVPVNVKELGNMSNKKQKKITSSLPSMFLGGQDKNRNNIATRKFVFKGFSDTIVVRAEDILRK